MTPTLIFIRSHEIDGRHFSHAEELPEGVLTEEQVAQGLDGGWLRESPRRRLYRLFAPFSGCAEKEELDEKELTQFALPQ